MAGISASGAQPVLSARAPLRRRAAGIYGTIITAAALRAPGDHVPTFPLGVSVLGTLLVYWVAEEDAELLGERLEGGQGPTCPACPAARTGSSRRAGVRRERRWPATGRIRRGLPRYGRHCL